MAIFHSYVSHYQRGVGTQDNGDGRERMERNSRDQPLLCLICTSWIQLCICTDVPNTGKWWEMMSTVRWSSQRRLFLLSSKLPGTENSALFVWETPRGAHMFTWKRGSPAPLVPFEVWCLCFEVPSSSKCPLKHVRPCVVFSVLLRSALSANKVHINSPWSWQRDIGCGATRQLDTNKRLQ